MRIEVPDDLNTLTLREMDVLEAQAADLIVNLRVQRRTSQRSADVLEGRPEWAKKLYRVVDDKRGRMGVIMIILAAAAYPVFGQSCGVAVQQFKATQRALHPRNPGDL